MTADILVREGRLIGLYPEGEVMMAELAVASDCESCRSRCLLGSLSEQHITIGVTDQWRPGAGGRAQMGFSRSALSWMCASVFGLPVGSWLIGAVVGNHLWGEAGGVLLGLGLLAGALLTVGANRRSLRRWVKLELIALRSVHVD